MTIIDRLFGRKKCTAETISNELATQGAALADARNRVDAAKTARQAALDRMDAEALKAADDAERDAKADVDIREHAVRELQKAHARQVEAERRKAFFAECAEHRAAKAALAERIASEYPAAAAAIGALCEDLRASAHREEELQSLARELGERVELGEHPEAFRREPVRWRGSWPSDDGLRHIHGSVQNAPRGAFQWQGGEPVPNRPNVTVHRAGGAWPDSLVSTVRLPGLRYGEKSIYSPPEEVPPAVPVPGMGRV